MQTLCPWKGGQVGKAFWCQQGSSSRGFYNMQAALAKSLPVRAFLRSAIVLLAFTVAAKIVSVFGHARILQTIDPVTGVSYRTLMLVAAAIEAAVVITLLTSKRMWFKLALICALANCFISYHWRPTTVTRHLIS